MSRLKALTLSLLLSSACAGAWASPSMVGTRGNLMTPDAEVVPTTKLDLTGSFVWIDSNGKTESNEWFSASYGLFERFEVGVSKLSYRTRKADDVLLSAKYSLRPETAKLPAVAVGTMDVTNELGFSEPTLYVVASRFLWAPVDEFTGEKVHPLRAFVGLGTGIYGGGFGGVNWQLRKDTRLTLEYAKNRALGTKDHMFNLGAQASFGKISVNAAAVDMQYPSLSLSYAVDSLF